MPRGNIVVQDNVCIFDTQNGETLGSREYRYGLSVVVLGITAYEKWTSTAPARYIKFGGPKGFSFNDSDYRPLENFSKPRSVIAEVDVTSSCVRSKIYRNVANNCLV
jgi:hypothetical protein